MLSPFLKVKSCSAGVLRVNLLKRFTGQINGEDIALNILLALLECGAREFATH